jgi:hypothetical protein
VTAVEASMMAVKFGSALKMLLKNSSKLNI